MIDLPTVKDADQTFDVSYAASSTLKHNIASSPTKAKARSDML